MVNRKNHNKPKIPKKLPASLKKYKKAATRIREQKLEDRYGQFDPENQTITIASNQPELCKEPILLHEIMHDVENDLILEGILKKCINHNYIIHGSLRIWIILGLNNFLRNTTPDDVKTFIKKHMYRYDQKLNVKNFGPTTK